MSKTLLELDSELLQSIGDFKQTQVTTAIAASTTLISTNFPQWRTSADYFNNFYVLAEDQDNAGAERYVSDDDGTNTLSVRTAWAANTTGVKTTIRLSRYSWAQRKRAITEAVNELYPAFYVPRDVRTLVTGNALPNGHFEDWDVSTAPDKYAMSDAQITATASTTAGTFWGGGKSMLLTAGTGGAGKYAYITSNTYPRLLDLMGKTVNFRAWANPDTADDAVIEIYTIQAAGSTQTLASTTSATASRYTLLSLENQTLNDDLTEIQFRFKVTTASKLIYYDAARVESDVKEYLLPTTFNVGSIDQISIQETGHSESPCDDIFPRDWTRIQHWDVEDNGTDKHLRFPTAYTANRQIRLEGNTAFTAMTTYTDTMAIDDRRIPLLIAYAKYKLYQLVPGIPAAEDISGFDSAAAKAYWEFRQLSHLRMPNKPKALRMRKL